jgi:hypothetical protein
MAKTSSLVEPIVEQGYDSAIGSRREPLLVIIKSGARDARGLTGG